MKNVVMRRIAWFALLLVPAGFGYVRRTTSGTPPVPLIRVDNAAIAFFLNNQVVAGAQSASGKTVVTSDSNPTAAVRSALATWNTVGLPAGSANISFLPLQSTTALINSNDFQATIAIGSTASDISAVGGALAVTVNSFAPVPANVSGGNLVSCGTPPCTYPAGGITDSDIIINPAYTFSTTQVANSSDLQAVITHELGHSLSANHTGVLGGTMYPYVTGIGPRYLTTDDLAFVNSVYPAPSNPAPFGTISGTISATGGTGIAYGMITMIDTSGGNTIGGLTNPDGTFSVQVPPATYIVYAEPYNPLLNLSPANFYLSAAAPTFQATMYGGFASPTQVAVAANGAATVNITVTAGTTPLNIQFYGFGGAGKSGDVTHFIGINGPIQVPSGMPQTPQVDFVFIGNGLGATLTDANFRVYGQGISVVPGTVRVDNSVILNGSLQGLPLMRATLNISARTSDTLASIFIDTPAGTLSLSAIFTVTPPAPAVTAAGLISNASYKGSLSGNGAASPGGIYSLFYSSYGPTALAQNPPNYDAYGKLPTTLGGVTVTFDGIPAPLFFVSAGTINDPSPQINLQVPFELAGQTSTQLVVNYLGSTSPPVTVTVLPDQPAFFTVSQNGAGPVIAYDATTSMYNNAQHPSAPGDVIEVFGTGVGLAPYSVKTGEAAPAPPSSLTPDYTYSIGGAPSTNPAFGFWSTGFAGLGQWNLQIPANSATGLVPITVTDTATGATSPTGTTIYVK